MDLAATYQRWENFSVLGLHNVMLAVAFPSPAPSGAQVTSLLPAPPSRPVVPWGSRSWGFGAAVIFGLATIVGVVLAWSYLTTRKRSEVIAPTPRRARSTNRVDQCSGMTQMAQPTGREGRPAQDRHS
jgi:hypothetical protein